jgi:hypothetical protein
LVNKKPRERKLPSSKKKKDYYRFSLTKKCSVRKLMVVKTAKKMASNEMFGHQKDC